MGKKDEKGIPRLGKQPARYRFFLNPYQDARGFSGKIDVMAWSPNGKYIVTAGRHDATTVWKAP